MSVLLLAWILGIGLWVSQDAIASILHYLHSDENWHFNHACRLARLVCGLALVIIASIELAEM